MRPGCTSAGVKGRPTRKQKVPGSSFCLCAWAACGGQAGGGGGGGCESLRPHTFKHTHLTVTHTDVLTQPLFTGNQLEASREVFIQLPPAGKFFCFFLKEQFVYLEVVADLSLPSRACRRSYGGPNDQVSLIYSLSYVLHVGIVRSAVNRPPRSLLASLRSRNHENDHRRLRRRPDPGEPRTYQSPVLYIITAHHSKKSPFCLRHNRKPSGCRPWRRRRRRPQHATPAMLQQDSENRTQRTSGHADESDATFKPPFQQIGVIFPEPANRPPPPHLPPTCVTAYHPQPLDLRVIPPHLRRSSRAPLSASTPSSDLLLQRLFQPSSPLTSFDIKGGLRRVALFTLPSRHSLQKHQNKPCREAGRINDLPVPPVPCTPPPPRTVPGHLMQNKYTCNVQDDANSGANAHGC